MKLKTFAAVAALACLGAGAAAAQTTPYFITDGDADTVYKVQNGALVSTFSSAAVGIGYGIAVRSNVLIHDRDDTWSAEYTQAGVATGVTHAGPSFAGEQLLDGAADATSNYLAGFSSRRILRYDTQFLNPTVAFTMPAGVNPGSIAVDTTSGALFIQRGLSGSIIDRYTTAGVLQGTIAVAGGGQLCCLAYEAASDTLWMVNRGVSPRLVVQVNKATGAVMQTLPVAGFNGGNVWGGEMQVGAAPPAPPAAVPTLTEWAMILLGMALAGVAGLSLQRRRATV